MILTNGETNLYKRYAQGSGEQRHRGNEHGASTAMTARKDDAAAAVHADIVNIAGVDSVSVGGEMIQATSG